MSIGSRLNQLEQAAGSSACANCKAPLPRVLVVDRTIDAEPLAREARCPTCGHELAGVPGRTIVLRDAEARR